MSDNQDKKASVKIISRLKNKYRLVIMNDETFEEKLSLTLSPLNVITVFGSFTLLLIISMVYFIAFTPLREYIPGYADIGMRRKVFQMSTAVDSLQREMKMRDEYLAVLKNIIEGKSPEPAAEKGNKSGKQVTKTGIKFSRSKEDSLLRKMVAEEDNALLQRKQQAGGSDKNLRTKGLLFFKPVSGVVSSAFNTSDEHYGVDIVTAPDETVKATLDGKVIFSGWTIETGHVLVIQHEQNLISLYKHNSILLKKTGNYVQSGEPIAIVGNSGELSTGPHLHFEVWQNGKPLNPKEIFLF